MMQDYEVFKAMLAETHKHNDKLKELIAYERGYTKAIEDYMDEIRCITYNIQDADELFDIALSIGDQLRKEQNK